MKRVFSNADVGPSAAFVSKWLSVTVRSSVVPLKFWMRTWSTSVPVEMVRRTVELEISEDRSGPGT